MQHGAHSALSKDNVGNMIKYAIESQTNSLKTINMLWRNGAYAQALHNESSAQKNETMFRTMADVDSNFDEHLITFRKKSRKKFETQFNTIVVGSKSVCFGFHSRNRHNKTFSPNYHLILFQKSKNLLQD